MQNIQMDATTFRCKIYEPAFHEVMKSYNGEPHAKEIMFKGGGASGKSVFITKDMLFWLMEREHDQALIVTYQSVHQLNTVARYERELDELGIPYERKSNKDGRIDLLFGTHKIMFMIVKSSSYDQMIEKMKTFVTSEQGVLKFIWFEEFTAILREFVTFEKFYFSVSRLYRELRSDSMIFYAFNPPDNGRDPIYSFIEQFTGMIIHSTIFDLPKAWQSQEDLRLAEHLEKTNPKLFANIYMGERSGTKGLAFLTDYEMLVDYPQEPIIDYQITVDNGSKDATTFSVWGIGESHNVYYIDGFYHSGRDTGQRMRFSEYALILARYIKASSYKISAVITDSLIFTDELAGLGIESKFIDKKKIDNVGFRALCYDYASELVERRKLKVCREGDYMMFINQLSNAEVDVKGKRASVKRPNNENTPEDRQIHKVDTFTYFMYANSRRLLGREKARYFNYE